MRANSISEASCIALLNDVGLPLINNSWREIAGKSPVKKRCNSIGDVVASPGYDSVNSFCSSKAKSETFSPEA